MVEPDLISTSYVLASPRVAEAIFKEALHYQHNKIKDLLAAAGTSNLGGLPGLMFEQHGHAVMPAGGKVRMRRLEAPVSQLAAQPAAQPDEEEEGEEELMYSHHNVAPLPNPNDTAQQLQQHADEEVEVRSAEVLWDKPGELCSNDPMYLRPLTINNAAWDAYYVNGPAMWLLQYTVSSRQQGVSARAVLSFLQRLSPELRQQVAMVFIVPTDHYDKFAWQPWLGARRNVLQRVPDELKDMQQWVMQLPEAPAL